MSSTAPASTRTPALVAASVMLPPLTSVPSRSPASLGVATKVPAASNCAVPATCKSCASSALTPRSAAVMLPPGADRTPAICSDCVALRLICPRGSVAMAALSAMSSARPPFNVTDAAARCEGARVCTVAARLMSPPLGSARAAPASSTRFFCCTSTCVPAVTCVALMLLTVKREKPWSEKMPARSGVVAPGTVPLLSLPVISAWPRFRVSSAPEAKAKPWSDAPSQSGLVWLLMP